MGLLVKGNCRVEWKKWDGQAEIGQQRHSDKGQEEPGGKELTEGRMTEDCEGGVKDPEEHPKIPFDS
jgi:hypothetical protein